MKEFSVEPVFAFVRLCALIRPHLYAGELARNELYLCLFSNPLKLLKFSSNEDF